MDIPQRVWQTAVRVSKGPEHLTYMEKVRYLGLFSLEKRRLSWKPAAALNFIVGAYGQDEARLISELHRVRTRDNSQAATKDFLREHRKKQTSSLKLLKHRNRLPQRHRDPSLKTLRIHLDKAHRDLKALPCLEQGDGFDNLQKSLPTKFQA